MSIDSQIMAPCPGCGMVLPTDLVACTDCLATLPDALQEQWAQVTGRHHDKTAAYLDARKAIHVWLKRKAEDRRIIDGMRSIGAIFVSASSLSASSDPARHVGAVL